METDVQVDKSTSQNPARFLTPMDKWLLPDEESYYETRLGTAYVGNSLELMKGLESDSVDLIVTSPPFALTRKKRYGNVEPEKYGTWFQPFAMEFWRILKPTGSLVIHIGTSWIEGKPWKTLYVYDLLISLCRKYEKTFNLAQEFFWYNPAKLPSPAEWVTVRRIRVKDAVDYIWWLCKTENAKADNRRILKEYSESMKNLLKNGYKAKLRPSEHNISENFSHDNLGAIPSNLLIRKKSHLPQNLLVYSNTESTSRYLRLCRQHTDIAQINPARYPERIPEFFIKFLTEPNDKVLEPYAGSNTTGHAAEMLGRRWMAFELIPEYLTGSIFRFSRDNVIKSKNIIALNSL
jgi:site-specific DNA-methyltransferase (cytosine-N4-specific)